MPIKEICCKGGFSDATFLKWRAKFGDMDVPDARRLRELEGENAKLKNLLAEAHLDMHAKMAAFATELSIFGVPSGGSSNEEKRLNYAVNFDGICLEFFAN